MFKPLIMQRVALKVMADDAPLAAVILAECGVFGPEVSSLPDDILPEHPSEHYARIFRAAQTRLDKIHQRVDYPRHGNGDEPRVVSLRELEAINDRLGKLWGHCSELEEQQRALQEEKKRLENLKRILDIFASLDLDLGYLQGTKNFLDLHIGTLPLVDLDRFQRAVTMEPYHFIKVFHKTQDTAYVMVAGPPKTDQDAHKLLQTADFHALTIPPEFKDHPQKIHQDLIERGQDLDRQLSDLETKIQETGAHCSTELTDFDQALRYAEPYAALSNTLRGGRSGLSLLEGWIPKREVPRLREALEKKLGGRFELTERDPLESEYPLVPTVLSHSRFLSPFEKLVKTFGIPRYNEVDPTVLFAITSVLMFGMMFGDVGHGGVIALLGWYFRHKLRDFTILIVAAGLSSVFFGALYGSVFGYEGVFFHPLWMSPISDPMLMLTLALIWGISFILIACGLKIYNLLTEKRFKEAYFDSQGIAGLLFYLAGLFGAYRLAMHGQFGWLEGSLIGLPLLSVLAFKWHELHGSPFGEKIIVVLIEGFDFMMNFISNTLSFMRVAAFSLNHAALAIAVFTLANGMGLFGHWTTVVLGNIFILVLEGAIVGIQVLRLEYYEGFARFFSGDGRAFHPLVLRDSAK